MLRTTFEQMIATGVMVAVIFVCFVIDGIVAARRGRK